MKKLRYRIRFNDRVGMVRDISEIVAKEGANISSLAVKRGEIYLQVEPMPDDKLHSILRDISRIPDVYELTPVEWMPHELAEQQLRTVINSVREGILSINRSFIISTCNVRAMQILGFDKPPVGAILYNVLDLPEDILELMEKGKPVEQKEVIIRTSKGPSRFMINSKPIFDDRGKTAGAVITIMKMSEIRRLAHSLTRPVMVTFEDIIYQSKKIKEIVDLAKTVAAGDSTVLLRGESGTGKELFARAIHMESPRRDYPFVAVNCAAIPDTLLESELFGYADGTFTGARRGGRPGLFEFAHHGTIFLDEIAELPPHIQAKLLRVLQEGSVRRLGEMEEIRVDVRIIAATNRSLEEMIVRGDFRADLFYRLNVIPIYLPPLREHKEDIPVLVDYFIKKFNQKFNKSVQGISPDALELLLNYHWPGNIRELENVMERAMNLCKGHIIKAKDIIINTPSILVSPGEKYFHLEEMVRETEKEALLRALSQGGSARKAAKILGVSHTTVIKKIKKYGLTPD
ncbi:sigma 54-interacting transcriptional regulator [Thermosediminibacter litoriperuensis]|uniref:HTH-type transcriptional regulatory protein TyrR n=1 Tax=Thermosediminibacter litoriperuensis TaxID=291989 RepID=A0A5S5AV42_9FIRM|nr:sigma 54-interacting transcriptional regulator [Thermosediminibacter litoriperuensis]TYP56760.1 transcriptional regulator of aroF, aroG, tyrA and aromatic amino acid transport [Thermosediminibacter litoriperuensis]